MNPIIQYIIQALLMPFMLLKRWLRVPQDLPTSLIIANQNDLAALTDLPASLTSLDIIDCARLISLPDLPARLISLQMEECSGLTSLPNLPASLTSLDMHGCSGLTSLPDLPASLTFLRMEGAFRLTSLPNLPASLASLDLYGCSGLTSPPDLPTSLKYLSMNRCFRLISLPDLPASLTSVDITSCTRLTLLPDLPASLKFLYMPRCIRLTSLPNLPDGLKLLSIRDCSGLRTLPDLPASLTVLNLEGCTSLRLTAELSAQLQRLEALGCDIRYPEHFTVNTQSQLLIHRLADAIQAASLQPKPVHIQELLHRFLSESLGQRGGVLALCAMVEPIVDFLESSPQHLAWAENIASGFLDGCVNQPVRGWSEIASWMYVAQASDCESQIEAVRYPLALRSIEELIAKESPGQNVEVEGANALLSQSYAQLQSTSDITRPWPCIPQGIAYEGMIRSWLTEDKVSSIVKKVQGLSLEDLAQSVSNTAYSSFWGDIVFPEHIKVIYHKYEQLMENHDSLIRLREGAPLDIVLSELGSDERREDFQKFQASTEFVGTAGLQEIAGSLLNKREAELSQCIRTLTQKSLEKIGSKTGVAPSISIAFSDTAIESDQTLSSLRLRP